MNRNVVIGTDFGERDGSANILSAVVDRINPETKVFSLSHYAESIEELAFYLLVYHRDFRPGTIFVAVVDPGVGTERKILLAECQNYCFIGPDNGILWPVLEQANPEKVFVLDGEKIRKMADRLSGCQDEYFKRPASDVFHARDYFVPAAALISKGAIPKELGEKVELDALKKLNFQPESIGNGNTLLGRVALVDTWGNIITTITRGDFDAFVDEREWSISVGEKSPKVEKMVRTFAEAEAGQIAAHAGGDFIHPDPKKGAFIALFINQGNASEALGGIEPGELVIVERR